MGRESSLQTGWSLAHKIVYVDGPKGDAGCDRSRTRARLLLVGWLGLFGRDTAQS